MDMKTLALLIAALAAVPASAEVYECRGNKGSLGVQAEAAGNRLAIHDGRKVTRLCGRGAAPAQCGRTSDGGYTYAGTLGMIQFVPEGGVSATPAAFQMRAPGEAVWTKYMCLKADAKVRRSFGGRGENGDLVNVAVIRRAAAAGLIRVGARTWAQDGTGV
jgi:hypothetical protein